MKNVAGKKKQPFSKKYKREIVAYSLIGIPLLWWTVFFVVALLWAFFTSFTNMRGGYGLEFATKIDFQNYINIFTAGSSQFKAFWNAMKVTLLWTVVMMIGNNVMGILCAFLIKSLKRGGKFFLAFLFWPSLVSAVVGADISKTLFASDSSGIVNQIIMFFGGSSVQWLENS
ncbi:MAG: hypothetical protein ACLTE4_09950, partial [Christensenellaceae bacterium]